MTTMQLTPEQQARRKRPMNPAIPEIAKAYQQDPRTALAQQALATGTNTAPVAQGSYAWADGLARALQGVAGGYIAKKQMQRYGDDEEALLATRRARGLDGMNGTAQPGATPPIAPAQAAPLAAPQAAPASPAPVPAQPSPVAPAVASQAAAILGSPAPQGGPQGPSGGPPAPAPQGGPNPLAFALPQDQQGGPMRRTPPFVQVPATAASRSSGQKPLVFVDPLNGTGTPTSGYGPRKAPIAGASTFHGGQDYAAALGTPVRASADGTVIRAWNDTKNGGGNSVLIRHPDGSVTGYAHMADFGVQRGDTVAAGQPIGNVGQTGRATGPQLHFTYRDPSGRKINPTQALKFGEVPQGNLAQAGVPQTPAQLDEVPAEPTPFARPEAPTAEPATKARLLNAAYRMMADGNRYESATAQDMYDRGLSEQSRFDETAAERAQRIKDMGYQSDLGMFANDQAQRTAAGWDARSATRAHNWQVGDREDQQQYNTGERVATQGFQAGENAKNRSHDMTMARFNRDTQVQLQQSQQEFGRWQTNQEIQGRKEVIGEQARARRQGFLGTPTGMKIYNDAANIIGTNSAAIGKLNQFESILQNTRTGGFTLGNAPGLVKWSNSDIQVLESISADLAKSATGDMKGSLSDKDVQFVQSMVPNIRKTGRANRADITRLRGIFERANDFQRAKLRAMSDGSGVDFLYQWDAYTRAVPAGGPAFDQWQASVPTYDATGKRTN